MEADFRIVVVDAHPIFRRGLRQFIAEYSDHHVIGEASELQTALNLIHSLKPDVVIIDAETPSVSGLDLIRQVRAEQCPARFVVLTASRDEGLFQESIDLGVQGYLLKDDDPDFVLQSLRALEARRPFISPALSDLVVQRTERRQVLQKTNPSLRNLTPMERRILRLIAQNKTTKMIAEELYISPYTVETHRGNISAKLDLRGTQPVLRFALEHKFDL